MKPVDARTCKVHVLVCTNQRPEGRTGCRDFGGQVFYDRLKSKLKETGKISTHWATRTGCLGFCNAVGTTITIHRPGQSPEWVTEVTAEDFDSVWEKIVR